MTPMERREKGAGAYPLPIGRGSVFGGDGAESVSAHNMGVY